MATSKKPQKMKANRALLKNKEKSHVRKKKMVPHRIVLDQTEPRVSEPARKIRQQCQPHEVYHGGEGRCIPMFETNVPRNELQRKVTSRLHKKHDPHWGSAEVRAQLKEILGEIVLDKNWECERQHQNQSAFWRLCHSRPPGGVHSKRLSVEGRGNVLQWRVHGTGPGRSTIVVSGQAQGHCSPRPGGGHTFLQVKAKYGDGAHT